MIHDTFHIPSMYNKTLLSWMLRFGVNVDGWSGPIYNFFTLRIIIVDPFFITTYNLIQKCFLYAFSVRKQ